jgi:ABC-type antimicrobial peptide transport system permease subunit
LPAVRESHPDAQLPPPQPENFLQSIRVGYCAGFVFGVKPLDPLSFIATPLLLSIIALVSIWLPAWRATRVNPIAALRVE